MDPNGHIYMSDEVPEEDAARLDGFLRGRAESDALRKEDEQKVHKIGEQLAEFKAKLAEAERASQQS